MRAIDTNVLVRLIARDDSRQAASADIFIEKGAWVSGTFDHNLAKVTGAQKL